MLFLLLATLSGYPFKNTWGKFIRSRNLLLLTSLFFIYLITGLYSDDQAYFWERIRIALPLLFLPFAFSRQHINGEKELNKWLYFFFILMVITGLYSMGGTIYRQHIIEVSQDLTTPINHVRYSLLLAFSVFVGLHLYLKKHFSSSLEKNMVLAATFFQVICLHYLAVRSGLVGFFAVFVFTALKYMSRIKKSFGNKWAIMAALPILLGCTQLPSFQHELKTTQASIISYLGGVPVGAPSDHGRLLSIEVGMKLGMENFWTGTGLGDLKNEMRKKYMEMDKSTDGTAPLPHNQFVFFFAFSGICGLVWCLYLSIHLNAYSFFKRII